MVWYGMFYHPCLPVDSVVLTSRVWIDDGVPVTSKSDIQPVKHNRNRVTVRVCACMCPLLRIPYRYLSSSVWDGREIKRNTNSGGEKRALNNTIAYETPHTIPPFSNNISQIVGRFATNDSATGSRIHILLLER